MQAARFLLLQPDTGLGCQQRARLREIPFGLSTPQQTQHVTGLPLHRRRVYLTYVCRARHVWCIFVHLRFFVFSRDQHHSLCDSDGVLA